MTKPLIEKIRALFGRKAQPVDFSSMIDGFYQDYPEKKGVVFFLDGNRAESFSQAAVAFEKSLRETQKEYPHFLAAVMARLKRNYEEKRPVETNVGAGDYWDRAPDCAPVMNFVSLPAVSIDGRPFHESYLTDYLRNFLPVATQNSLPPVKIPQDAAFHQPLYWLCYAFDHECGHALASADSRLWREAEKRDTAAHIDECVADTYALLRHYQRFGADTGFDDALIKSRARLLPHIGAGRNYAAAHMTAECLYRVSRDKPSAATPREALASAIDSALAHSMTREKSAQWAVVGDQSQKIMEQKGFAPFIQWLKEKTDLPALPVQLYLESAAAFHGPDKVAVPRTALPPPSPQ